MKNRLFHRHYVLTLLINLLLFITFYLLNASLPLLATQMPVLKKKFSSYESFKGVKDIAELFDDYKDKIVEEKE